MGDEDATREARLRLGRSGFDSGAAVAHRLPPRRSLHAFTAILVLVVIANAAAAVAAL